MDWIVSNTKRATRRSFRDKMAMQRIKDAGRNRRSSFQHDDIEQKPALHHQDASGPSILI
jgi:hypothetical protein